MSKWCGDENCLQCIDKEPDPYVHLPRADYDALREQNRVLASLLAKAQPHVCSMLCPSVKREGDPWTHKDLCTHITAALTATRQEG